jgi:hypothetical protein
MVASQFLSTERDTIRQNLFHKACVRSDDALNTFCLLFSTVDSVEVLSVIRNPTLVAIPFKFPPFNLEQDQNF